jgi:hypothetical protein
MVRRQGAPWMRAGLDDGAVTRTARPDETGIPEPVRRRLCDGTCPRVESVTGQ